jgi:hypothetical protein
MTIRSRVRPVQKLHQRDCALALERYSGATTTVPPAAKLEP